MRAVAAAASETEAYTPYTGHSERIARRVALQDILALVTTLHRGLAVCNLPTWL